MRKSTFDYAAAKQAGYSDDEIMSHLSEINPKFDIQAATESGYSPQEINEYLSSYKPKKSKLEKGARVAGQYALGAAENILLPYELAVAPLASKEAQTAQYRGDIGEDIENMLVQKSTGVWDEKDEELLKHLQNQIQNPEASEKYINTADIGVRGLAEKITGEDLHPEGFLEKAASWAGFIKNPKNLMEIAKTGIKPKELIKAIAPSGKEALRGIGAGIALEEAEQGNYGPIGTMASAIIGDVIGGKVAGAGKSIGKFVASPKKTLAEAASKFTSKDKVALQKQIIKDFRDSGIQADLGSLTDNNLVKWTQSRLAQSGLTGRAFDDLRESITNQIKNEYKILAEGLGEAKFATQHEAGEALRETIKRTREADLAATRQLYSNADKALKEKAFVPSQRLASAVESLEKQLKPGAIKSTEQTSVLSALGKLKNDLFDTSGKLMYADVKDLMNNKIALNDIINYEVQGGAKQLLKGIVSEIDRAIISHGKQNPTFAKNYINANKRFSEHAKTFRNKEVDQLLRASDPVQLLNKMNSVQGIRTIEKILSKTPQGKETFNNLKRLKVDKAIGENLVDSTTQQVKLGTFSKLLEKGNNKEIFKEILGKEGFKRLEKLQKNSGKLAETAQKFFNSSKSGATLEDMAIVGKAFSDMAHLFAGNPWPIVKMAGGILGARYLTKLMTDANFLKMVEEAVLASEKNNTNQLISIGEELSSLIKAAMLESQNLNTTSEAQSEKNIYPKNA